jgi:hypothetical protein
MDKLIRLSRLSVLVLGISLFMQACSPGSSGNASSIVLTPTVTAASNSSNNDPTATPEIAEASTPFVLTPVAKIDPCSFFTNAEIEPVVGTALIDATPGTDFDEVTGGPLDYCTYKGDDVALVLSIVKSNAAQNSPEWQRLLLETANSAQPTTALTPSTTLGEQAYWVVNEDSAGWFVAKYPYVFALVVGGNIGYAEDYKEDLQSLGQKVANSLP